MRPTSLCRSSNVASCRQSSFSWSQTPSAGWLSPQLDSTRCRRTESVLAAAGSPADGQMSDRPSACVAAAEVGDETSAATSPWLRRHLPVYLPQSNQ